MSLTLRDQYVRECWVPSQFRTPPTGPQGVHFPVEVWGWVDDEKLRLEGKKAFQDVVCWWPALGKWTVTLQCRADEDAVDFVCTVTYWQPLPPGPL